MISSKINAYTIILNMVIFIFWFLYIYGPVIDGFGQGGDISLLISLIFCLKLVFSNMKIRKELIFLSGILLTIFIFSSLNFIFLDDQTAIAVGLRGVFRPVRALIHLIGGYSLVKYTYEKKSKDSNYSVLDFIIFIIYISILTHSIIMIFQFIFPEFRNLIYNFTTAKHQFMHYQHFRLAGLSGAGGAQLSVVQSLAIPISFYFLKNKKHWLFWIMGNFIIFSSLIISGRSGFLTIFLTIILYGMLAFFNLIHSFKVSKYLLKAISISSVFLVMLSIFLFVQFKSMPYFDVAIQHSLSAFISNPSTGQTDGTFKALSKMFILPENVMHLVFGKVSYIEVNTYYTINTDIGYFQLIWAYGLLGLFLHSIFYLYLLVYPLYFLKKSLYIDKSILVSFIVFLILFFNAKETFFLTRMTFPITIGLFFAFVYNKDIHRFKRSCVA